MKKKTNITYKRRVKNCNGQVIVENNRCQRKINGYRHNHPEIDDKKIDEIQRMDKLRKKISSLPKGRINWKAVLAEFNSEYPDSGANNDKQYIRSLQRLRNRTHKSTDKPSTIKNKKVSTFKNNK